MEGFPATSQCMDYWRYGTFKDIKFSVGFHSQSLIVFLCFPQLQTSQMEYIELTHPWKVASLSLNPNELGRSIHVPPFLLTFWFLLHCRGDNVE
jgi:hypothetical protein